MSANTRPSVRPTDDDKEKYALIFPRAVSPLPPLSPQYKMESVQRLSLRRRPRDPNVINVVTLSRPFAPSFLACSIPLSLIPPSHIMMKEGKHFLPELPLSPCHGRVGPLCPLRDDGALSPTHPSTRRDVARRRSCELSQIVASVNHAFDLPSRPLHPASSLLRRRSSYLAAASAPPTLIRSPSLPLPYVWFGAFVAVLLPPPPRE